MVFHIKVAFKKLMNTIAAAGRFFYLMTSNNLLIVRLCVERFESFRCFPRIRLISGLIWFKRNRLKIFAARAVSVIPR